MSRLAKLNSYTMSFLLYFTWLFMIAVNSLTDVTSLEDSSLTDDFDASAFTVAAGQDNNVDNSFSAASLNSDSLDGLRSTDESVFNDANSEGSTSENSNDLFNSSPNVDDSTNLFLADLAPSPNSVPISDDLFDLTQDSETPILLPISDQSTDQAQITETSDTTLLALDPGGNSHQGQPDDSQDLSFLDSEPLIPINPLDIFNNITPDIDPIRLPTFPNLAPMTSPPICEGGYFPFCCIQGPPNPATDAEKQKRRRKCYNCRL